MTYVSWFVSSFSLLVSECLYHCAATLWLITVSAYTSLLCVSYSLSVWISILVFGYILTHWTRICTSLDPCLFLSSLWVPLSVFGNIVNDCPWIISASFDLYFDLSFCLSVSVFAYMTANSACICTSLYSCFSLSLFFFECLYQSPNVLLFILGVYVRILIRVSLSLFLWLFMSVFGYIVTDCTYVGISLIPLFCLSQYLCISQCPGVLSVICMYVNKRIHLAQCGTAF